MLNTIKSYLQLLRLPNLFTIPGDIIVGFLLVTTNPAYLVESHLNTFWSVSVLILVSLAIYCFGLVQNDLVGYEEDKQLERKRPLVLGLISFSVARRMLIFFGLFSLTLPFLINWVAVAVSLSTLTLASVYNYLNQTRNIFAPIVMGLCRGFNILLGASLVGLDLLTFDLFNQSLWLCFSAHVIYIASVTLFARDEAKSRPHLLVCFFPYLTILILGLVTNEQLFILLSVYLLLATLLLFKDVTPQKVGQTVGTFISSLILIQYIWVILGTDSTLIQIIPILLFLGNYLSARIFYRS